MQKLQGKIALVTGATRGIGKGIAIGLGEAGATVYITGRSLDQSNAGNEISGSLKDTKLAIEAVGGTCIPVQVDHSNDRQVSLLFERIQDEQGKLDLLVNNVYSGVQPLKDNYSKSFWDAEPNLWDNCNNVGLRSHYVASIFAAKMMVKNRQGLICTISSWGGLSYIFGTAYGVGKAACDRLAADMAVELKPHNIASLAIWPGIVGTEHFQQLATEMNKSEIADRPNSAIRDRYNWETPLFTGRVIAALAADQMVIKRTGKVQIVAELAEHYGLVDENSNRPASLRSLRFIIPFAFPALRKYTGLIPNIKIPWMILLLKSLSSPKI